ncbi:MAG TPA: hypothetical protein PLL39_09925 [Rhodocyclaceae bacterium]|nr:hypothetical protein [Rhodocyclaceae bacterium]HNB66103.1 hypothetical protein [Rhodocyclaceae bacterium]HNC80725.1 hypothetical protein [Rhodocyclaceae bacterium]HNE16333.1 hypothetical protein [Rhodocyclaceae bacterium]
MPTLQEEGREKWIHEDNLLNHRLSWLGVTQGLLFAALGLIISQTGTTPMTNANLSAGHASDLKAQLLAKLINGVPLLGLVSSLLILVGTLAATVAMAKIKKRYELPEYGISLITTVFGWICAVGIPYIFCVAWLIIINGHWGSVFSVLILFVVIATWIRVVKANA